MKTLVYVAVVLAVMLVSAAAFAANTPCCTANTNSCPSCGAGCNTPAYDRTPICYPASSGSGPCCIPVDPWKQCGAFCTAGQLSPGWPFGWHASYWLRPDSNF